MIAAPKGACGVSCTDLTRWRSGSRRRLAWKAACTFLLSVYCGWFMYQVRDTMALIVIGAVFLFKLLAETWGQDTVGCH